MSYGLLNMVSFWATFLIIWVLDIGGKIKQIMWNINAPKLLQRSYIMLNVLLNVLSKWTVILLYWCGTCSFILTSKNNKTFHLTKGVQTLYMTVPSYANYSARIFTHIHILCAFYVLYVYYVYYWYFIVYNESLVLQDEFHLLTQSVNNHYIKTK